MAGFKTRDPERNAANLRRRFSRVSAQALPKPSRLPKPGFKTLAVGILLCIAAGSAFHASRVRGWEFTTYLLHIAAAPNCAHARAVGLAPARRHAPGYYAGHDRDNDGWSCEDYP